MVPKMACGEQDWRKVSDQLQMRRLGEHVLLVQSLGQLLGAGLGEQQARLQLAWQVFEILGAGQPGTALCKLSILEGPAPGHPMELMLRHLEQPL